MPKIAIASNFVVKLTKSRHVSRLARLCSILIFPGITPHRSLNSTSNRIRWSFDFRLHNKSAVRPGKTADDWFYGLKDSLVIRDPSKKNFVPDWGSWANIDRTEVQDQKLGGEKLQENFDPVITGPWMDLWDIEEDVRLNKEGSGPRPNQHTERYLKTEEELRDVNKYIEQGNW